MPYMVNTSYTMQFFTIGVYHTTEEDFFGKLTRNGIDTFCDIRQRRAVRGPRYPFANSNNLQAKLAALGIRYEHVIDLAPTAAIRHAQEQADRQKGILRSDRAELTPQFTADYRKEILARFDFDTFLQHLKDTDAKKVVLFCVEEHAGACHRSLVAEVLAGKYEYAVTHL